MKTKRLFISILLLLLLGTITVLNSGCATIVGGSNYYAHVDVRNNDEAAIYYNNELKGYGGAAFKVPRAQANNFAIRVVEQNCNEETFKFHGRIFRGWSLVGTLVTWTIIINGAIPIPAGVIVDAATQAWWKPDILEKDVTKIDYNHYQYTINYTGCQPGTITKNDNIPAELTNEEKRVMLNVLLKQGTITQKEYDREISRLKEKKEE